MAQKLPVMLLKDLVLLPKQEVKIELTTPNSQKITKLCVDKYSNYIIVVSPNDSLEESPEIDDLPTIAVRAHIERQIPLPNKHIRLTIKGIERIKIKEYFESKELKESLACTYEIMEMPEAKEANEVSLKREIKKLVRMYVKSSNTASNEVLEQIKPELDLSDLCDLVASELPMSKESKIAYISELSAIKRAEKLIDDLIAELQFIKLDQKINANLQEELDKAQKEFVLKEKLQTIQKELGEEDQKSEVVKNYEEELSNLSLPSSTTNRINREIRKYSITQDSSPEITFIRNYLDTFFSLPWNEETVEAIDLNSIERNLNKTHYGLKKVKERILEYAAMKSRNPILNSPIICLVGPPGVGKSTIASSIARSLHRSFAKISVGGLNDSSELTGHRRTYIGSSPGKIITALQKCGSKNPVLLIDEVDKMVHDYKGDPASVLLDILDPNLNQTFTDYYLEEPFDLSHVFFILTANRIDEIPVELRDRLEIIEISSYTIPEKIALAKDYLLPLVYLDYHIHENALKLGSEELKYLITNYTSEAGVRDLKRKLEELYRKIVLYYTRKKENLPDLITKKDIKKFLDDSIEMEDKVKVVVPGLVNAVAVSDAGGRIIPIESVMYKGTGKVEITGLAGDVMKESLDVVLSYIKNNSHKLKIDPKIFKEKDIHIHFLEAALPKNGPSAGVAITTALLSLFKNKVIPQGIALSGEMTLRGEVLPIGGAREKVVAAYNKGLKRIYMPFLNKEEVLKLQPCILKQIEVIYIKEYKEIYKHLFDN